MPSASLKPRWGLSGRTLDGLKPALLVELAAQAGFSHVGVPMEPLLATPEDIRAARAAVAATGTFVLDCEPVRILEKTDFSALERLFEAAAQLGASHALAIAHDSQLSRVVDTLGAVCALGDEFSLDVGLEFMPFRGVKSLPDASWVVNQVGSPRAKLVLDIHHFFRSGAQLTDLAPVPGGLVANVQICDLHFTPAMLSDDQVMQEALTKRLLPGEGNLPCRAFVEALGRQAPLSLELLGATVRKRYPGDSAFLAAAWRAMERVLIEDE